MKKIGDDGTPLQAVESSTGTSGAISAWRRAFEKTGLTDHGFSESTIWVEELGIWLAVGGWERDEAHRYWNGLGDRLGGKKSRNLIVEVNPPDGGPRGRWQGLAARDEQGSTWLLHSGEMNVGGRRVQLSEALRGSPVRRRLVSFADGDVVPYFVVAHLSTDPIDVVRQTARFTQACSRVRTRVTDAANPEFIEAQDRAVLLEESIGFTVVPPQAAKKIERVHARIWHALRDELLAKGFVVANQRVGALGPDLYTVGRDVRYLIEIKTAFSASDYMKAVGQLVVYEKMLRKDYRKILVLPKGLGPIPRKLLTSLDITVVDFDDRKTGTVFHWNDALKV